MLENNLNDLSYDPASGNVYSLSGSLLGTPDHNGHLLIRCQTVLYKAHRIAWLLHYGSWPNGEIDHINGDTSDNRIANLRDVSHQENQKNQKLRSTNKTGITGVRPHKYHNQWAAEITVDGKNKYLGLYPHLFEAACARKSAERRHGYHINHGRIMCQK